MIQVTAIEFQLDYDALLKTRFCDFQSSSDGLRDIFKIRDYDMLQLGTKAPEPREMILDDIYLLRLKLLLHMTKDYFEGREFSDLRRQIILETARHIQMESIDLGCLDKSEETDLAGQTSVLIDHYFYRSANQLATLMEMMAKGQLLDVRLRKALQEKFEAIRHIQNTVYFTELLPGYTD